MMKRVQPQMLHRLIGIPIIMHLSFITPTLRPSRHRPRIHHPAGMTASTPTPEEKPSPNAALWKSLTIHPVLLSATLKPTITAKYTQRDLLSSTKRTFITSYNLSSTDTYHASLPTESDTPTHHTNAPGTFLRFPTKDDKTYLEVWTPRGLQKSCKLPHGKLYTDEWFAGVSVSVNNEYVAYIAEPKLDNGANEDDWRQILSEKYDITASDPLGEAYTQKRRPQLFIHHIPTGTTKQAISPEDDVLPGQPVWHSTKLIFTLRSASTADMVDRFSESVYDLGVRYCYNRHSQIGVITLDSGLNGLPARVSVLSHGELCVFAPRVWNDRLVYLATLGEESFVKPHNSAKVLRYIDLSAPVSEPRTLISIPDDPGVEEFPGLYAHDLPEEPWVDDKTLVCTSVWGSVNRLLAVQIQFDRDEEPVIVDLIETHNALFHEAGVSWVLGASITLLDARGGSLLIGASDPATPTQLLYLHFASGSIEKVIPVTTKSETEQRLGHHLQESLTVDLVAIDSRSRASFSETAHEFVKDRHQASERYQVTVLRPGRADKKHLIVYPHGGPHTSTVNGYTQSAMALLQKGYTVLYINYRGSLGLGERSLCSLPGNIGTQDVNEVVQATRWALKTYSLTDASFVGGSHSGFLGAHTSLIPGLFRGTVLRNPVVDIPSMLGGTDIPDWCFCEAGIRPSTGFIADAEVLKKMFQVSPVAFVNACNEIGRTLLQLGRSDRRVPVGQGLLWRRVLNARFGKVCDIRFYPSSGHAVDEVPEGDDAWVAALDFLDSTVTSPPTECLHISHRKE